MKTTVLKALTLLSLALAPAAVATENSEPGSLGQKGAPIDFKQLPAPAQNSVRGQAGSSHLDRIEAVNGDNGTTYHVSFKRDGKPAELWVDPAGHVLAGSDLVKAAPERLPLSAPTKVTFEELPGPVQKALRTYAGSAPIRDIEKGTLQGKTVYEAAVKRDNQTVDLRFTTEGTLVRDSVDDAVAARMKGGAANLDQNRTEMGRAPSVQTGGAAGASSDAETPTHLKKITFGQLPFPVLSTIQAQAGAERLTSLEQGKLGDRTIYQATFDHEGQHVQLQIGDDGTIISAPLIRK